MTTATAIKEKPILFSSAMVLAILDGRKGQTRRVLKTTIADDESIAVDADGNYSIMAHGRTQCDLKCPYGTVGDRLWVRERWRVASVNHNHLRGQFCTVQFQNFAVLPHPQPDQALFALLVKNEKWTMGETGIAFGKWRPSIHMPRWASRLTLEITGIRVERLNEITEADAIAEGAQCAGVPASLTNRGAFAKLWDSINGKRPGCSWAESPWVWALSFRRVETSQ